MSQKRNVSLKGTITINGAMHFVLWSTYKAKPTCIVEIVKVRKINKTFLQYHWQSLLKELLIFIQLAILFNYLQTYPYALPKKNDDHMSIPHHPIEKVTIMQLVTTSFFTSTLNILLRTMDIGANGK